MVEQFGQCERCGVQCHIVGPGNPKARLLRYAAKPQGLCVNCGIHDWLRATPPIAELIEKQGMEVLLFPHIQEIFGPLLRMGDADAPIGEIDWEVVVANWELPFPKKGKRNA